MALIPVEEAIERILELSSPLGMESVAVAEAIGRALAQPVRAVRTLPPTDVSAMDGYALRTQDLQALPIELEVVERIFAGQAPVHALEAGQCARIMTGATVPRGADAVVRQEDTSLLDDTLVEIQKAVPPGANIRPEGEEVEAGRMLLLPGSVLGLPEAAALWGQGVARIEVHQRPTVGIVSSGDELCAVWDEPNGRIVDTNAPMLAEAARQCGAVPTVLGRAPDNLEALTALLGRGASFDVLIAVAGASVGEKDFTLAALEHLGATIDFHGVAMKPGKPVGAGRLENTLVFLLPGNPVSALVTFELLVRPALRQLQGLPPLPPEVPAVLGVEVTKPKGLRHFLRATAEPQDGRLVATPLRSQSSGAISAAIGATHLISLGPEIEHLDAGAPISLISLNWTP
jgi:molybdopterin molybdotransferase